MSSDPIYIRASRYNLKAQMHNFRVFHRQMVMRPWHALVFAIALSVLGANAVFNWVDAPRWHQHPWMRWLLGGIAFVVAGYFLACALGWQRSRSDP